MNPLFRSLPAYDSVKTAGAETKLGPDANFWPQQILQAAFKSVPAIQDYNPDVTMQQTDPEQGVAYGALVLRTQVQPQNPNTSTPGMSADQAEPPKGFSKTVNIPILIREGKLMPLDLLVVPGEMGQPAKTLPLTERRVRQALFRPDIYDVVGAPPPDTSLTNLLFPPGRDGYNGVGSLMGMGKQASSLLENALAFAPTEKVAELSREVVRHIEAYRLNPECAGPLSKIAQANAKGPVSRQEILKTAASRLPATVHQITDLKDGNYQVKSASAFAWAPTSVTLSRGQLYKLAGDKVVQEVDEGGESTVSMDPSKEEGAAMDAAVAAPPAYRLITKPGVYRVQAHKSEGAGEPMELVGLVIPNLIDLEGEAQPNTLFSNGSHSAFQTSMGGILVSGAPASTPEAEPSGYGCFVGRNPEGEMVGTIPMEVQGGFASERSDGYMVLGVDGVETMVKIQPNIRMPMPSSGALLLPESFQWMPLNKSDAVVVDEPPPPPVNSQPDQVQKTASASKVYLSCQGSSFSVEGVPVEKLASDDRQFLNPSQTVFLLAGLGARPDDIHTKMAQAFDHGRMTELPVRYVAQPLNEGVKTASARIDTILGQFRKVAGVSLAKEAAYLPDPSSIDTLLALGLLTPDSVMSFVQKLPQLEETQRGLCELLLASRLGLQEVPAPALEKAIRGIEGVIEGLQVLQFQEQP